MQDGRSASLTAPNGLAQEKLLRSVLSDAGLEAHDVRYVEAHGTGTALGDPIETGALAAVYGVDRVPEDLLYVSGVKANIGHLEPAAGMAGLLAAILAVQYGQAPPNAQLRELNPQIAATVAGTCLNFPRELTSLQRMDGRRLVAGVSSFGYSGTIAHVLIEEAPVGRERREDALSVQVQTQTQSHLPHDAVNASGGGMGGSSELTERLVWQFAGQGTLVCGVGRELYDKEESFRKAMAHCDTVLEELVDVRLSDVLYPELTGKRTTEEAAEIIADTRYAQPLLVAFEYSMSEVWRSKGIVPSAVLGHSLGEYAAGSCVWKIA